MGGAPSQLLDEPPLVLGGSDVLADAAFFTDRKVSAVVSVCDATPPPDVVDAARLRVLHVDVEDRPETRLAPRFAEATAFIRAARAAGDGVYVHCTAGISRSTTVAAAYLIETLALSDAEALGHIQRCREAACPNAGFRAELREFAETRRAGREDGPGDGAASSSKAATAAGATVRTVARAAHATAHAPDEPPTALAARDLAAIARALQEHEDAARDYAAAAWVFRSDGRALPPEREADIFDDGDGNGPRVRMDDGYAKLVARRDELGADDDFTAPTPNFALDDFEAQKRRLRARLQPLVDAGARPGGSVGLEWLLDGQE